MPLEEDSATDITTDCGTGSSSSSALFDTSSGELTRAVLREISAGIMTCDERGRPTLMNLAMRRFFGLSESQPLTAAWAAECGLYLPDGVTRMPPQDEPWGRALAGETVRNVEMIVAPPASASRVLSVDAQPLHGRGGRSLGALVVVQDVTDRKWTEAELFETANRYCAIVESVKEVIFQIDGSGAWAFLNRAWSDVIGSDATAMLGKPWLDAVHPADRGRAAELVTTLAADDRDARRIELRLVTPDGSYRWVELFARRAAASDGALEVSGTFHDISDRKRADEALHLSDQILRQLPEAVIVTDLDGRIERWMGKAVQHFGYEVDEVRGKPLAFLCRPDFKERFHQPALSFLGEECVQVQEVICLRKDGTEIPVEITAEPIYDTQRRPVFMVAIARNITERNKAEAERARLIREQAARVEAERAACRSALLAEATTVLTASLEYDAALDGLAGLLATSMADWCLIELVDEQGGRRTVVRAKTDAQTVILRELMERHGPPAELREASQRVADGRAITQPIDGHAWLAAARPAAQTVEEDGLLAPHSLVMAPMEARGELIGYLALARCGTSSAFDDEERVLIEETSRRAALAIDNARLYHRAQRAIELRDEFLSIASHELRTPLQTLVLLTDSLRRKLDLQPDAVLPAEAIAKIVGTVGRQTDRLSQLIRELLDVSRIHGGQLELQREQVDLGAMIHEIIDRFGDQLARVRCTIDTSGVAAVTGTWDPLRLEQVVTNLLTNAIKYGAASPISISTEAHDGCARIRVQDRGIGIAKDDQARIFGRFERAVSGRHFGGLGLGLYITHQIVRAHGGTIRLESELGEGSTFIVELPCSP